MSEPIKPALTKEEWTVFPKVYFRRPRSKYWMEGDSDAELNEPPLDEGYGVEIVNESEQKGMWVWDDSWAVLVQDVDRHKLAALALYGQPFGFTREDVEAIREAACHYDTFPGQALSARGNLLRSVAARIDVLLPPPAPESQASSWDDDDAPYPGYIP